MKKYFFIYFLILNALTLWAQQFAIPAGAELLESTEFKTNGVPYVIERRYKLPSGEILYAYYDVEGSNSVTIQKIEQIPILALGKEINISGMPGYREFNFGDDRRKLVQFMKMMKIGEKKSYTNEVKTPTLGDHVFSVMAGWRSEFKLLLDLFDESWAMEHNQYSGNRHVSSDTTAMIRVRRYTDE